MTQHYSGGTVRTGSVRPILDVLQEMGCDPDQGPGEIRIFIDDLLASVQ